MSSRAAKLTEGEARALVAMVLHEDEPERICAFLVIGVEHPSHTMYVAHSSMPKTAAGKIAMQAAGTLAQTAMKTGELQVQTVLNVEPDSEYAHFANVGITPREAIGLEEENTGTEAERIEAIADRCREAEYRRATEG